MAKSKVIEEDKKVSSLAPTKVFDQFPAVYICFPVLASILVLAMHPNSLYVCKVKSESFINLSFERFS